MKKINRGQKVLKAFEFLKRCEFKAKPFSKKELSHASGWSESTVNTYISKKLFSYIIGNQDDMLVCEGISSLSENEFFSLLSQSNKKQKIIVNRNDYIHKAKAFVLTAVTIYNNPCLECRSYSYIVNMIIAWTSLFHALFLKKKIDPINLDGKSWSLQKCLNQYNYWKNNDGIFIKENLTLLIDLRNIIEHQTLPVLPDNISAYLQSTLMNFEKVLNDEFNYCISDSRLTLSLQFSNSSINAQNQIKAQTCSKAYQPIYEYIKDFEQKNKDIINDQRLRVFFTIDREITNNSKNSDIAAPRDIEFKNIDHIDPDKYNIVAIKNKIVSDEYCYKVSDVIEAVKKFHPSFNQTLHTLAWKHFKSRPLDLGKKDHKNQYSAYNHLYSQSYLYSDKWIAFIKENYDEILKL